MSWQDRIQKSIIITTGDGKKYTVALWLNPQKSIEWNGAEFAFIGVEGKLVKKEKLLGRSFPLEFYFTGADHLENYGMFEISLNDRRPCLIDHPYYNIIACQILSLNVDNSQANSTKVTCVALETIVGDNPRTVVNPVDAIQLQSATLNLTNEAELTEPTSISDINIIKEQNTQNYNNSVKIVTDSADASAYFNAFNTASSTVNSLTVEPVLAMRAAIAFITLPSKFKSSVQDRIRVLLLSMSNLRGTLVGTLTVGSKQLFQIQGASILSGLCVAAASPLTGNYTNSGSVLQVINNIVNSFRAYLEDLDSLQGINGGDPLNYIPGYLSITQLSDLVNLTVANLIQIALNGKKEISVTLQYDSNVILLAHKYYGSANLDQNIDDFINNNNLTYQDMLVIKKDRKIVYYK